MTKNVHVLQLENNKWFVYETGDVISCEWINKYRIVCKREMFPISKHYDGFVSTILLMMDFGKNNVRGTWFKSTTLTPQDELIINFYNEILAKTTHAFIFLMPKRVDYYEMFRHKPYNDQSPLQNWDIFLNQIM